MKQFLAILGGIFLVLLLVAALFLGYGIYKGEKLDASSQAYIKENIPTILSTWSKNELLKRASPQLLKTITNETNQIDDLFKKFSTLGNFKQIDSIKGDANISFTMTNGLVVTARYAVTAAFGNGEAIITVSLVQSSGQWLISGFFVDSDILLQ